MSLEEVENSRYKVVTEVKAGGATYTPKELADFVAAHLIDGPYRYSTARAIKVLDPATGDGELLMSLLERLYPMAGDTIEVHGFETDIRALNLAKARIRQKYPNLPVHLTHGDFLGFVLDETRPADKGGLFQKETVPSYDLIIANPPYVRTQIMGAEQAQLLSSQFGLNGRVDMYYAFIVAMAHVLKPGGAAGIIVSNRFMTTKSGGAVRHAIREHFNIKHVWDLGDTKIFDAAVLPAVLLVEKQAGQQQTTAGFTSIYATSESPSRHASNVLSALGHPGVVQIADGRRFEVKEGQLDISATTDSVWRVATVASDDWLATVEQNTWKTFGDIGKIRVGVKTCADKVFIRSDWESMPENQRPELLRPLTTHHVARRFRAAPARKSRHILYPHETIDGRRRVVDIDSYPKSKAYFEEHRAKLEGRTYVIEGGRKWFEIWVPQEPSSWALPKLVFRDISEEPTFWMDLDGSIVNGDCYWLVADKREDTELLWLAAAVANSTFIETFYDHSFNNKLYAGRRRFITQYVELFPLPDPSLPTSRIIIDMAKQLYEDAGTKSADSHAKNLDKLVLDAFGVSPKEVAR